MHARAVAALAHVLATSRDAQKVLRKALRPEWRGPAGSEPEGWPGDAPSAAPVTNAERAAIADAVLGVEVHRIRLAYLVRERVAAAYDDVLEEAGGPDAFGVDALEKILADAGVFWQSEDETDDDFQDDANAANAANLANAANAANAANSANAASSEDAPERIRRRVRTPESSPSLASYRKAADAMTSLRWLELRGVSDQTRVAFLSVLRGGATIHGDRYPRDPDRAFAARHSLPAWLSARFRAQFGDAKAAAVAEAMSRAAPVAIRRNAARCEREELAAALRAEGAETIGLDAHAAAEALAEAARDANAKQRRSAWMPKPKQRTGGSGEEADGGFGPPESSSRGDAGPREAASSLSLGRHVAIGAPHASILAAGRPKKGGVFGLSTYRAGWFEVQDAGSQCIATAASDAILRAHERESSETHGAPDKTRVWRVLDLCCGNGGKTLAICSALEAYTRRLKLRGAPPFAYRVDCYDVDARRLRHLRASAERAGVAHRVDADVARAALEKIVAAGGAYDAVLVDAPCSSSGALRRFPSLRWQMEEAATRRRPRARGGGGDDDDGDDDDDAFETLFEEEGRLFSFDSDADVDGDVVANETSSSGGARVPVKETADDDLRTNDSTTTPIGGLVAGSWPTTQRLLLARGAALCRPDGGALIYATCSMLEAENQDVARWFERRFGGGGGGEDAPLPEATGSERGGVFGSFAFAPDPFPPGWPSPIGPEGARGGDASHEAALNPVDHGTDGFYVARWRRRPRGAPRGGVG